ncbi:MAG: response regulator transcription factor [Bacteroidia bacterium]|nr:response regulator transcription factor [Bacteroidia bacterium]
MKKIQVILVDDHQLIRDGIKSLLQDAQQIEVINEASSASELFQLLKNQIPDILILDVSLPGMSGIEITKVIQKEYPTIRVMILSMYIGEDFIFNALKAGARGYLHKNINSYELITAIEEINKGNEYFSTQVSDIILKSFVKKAHTGVKQGEEKEETLTSRELEILKLVAEGFSNPEIAERLVISVRTVESHKTHIMQKLLLNTIADLVKFAIRNNIIEL